MNSHRTCRLAGGKLGNYFCSSTRLVGRQLIAQPAGDFTGLFLDSDRSTRLVQRDRFRHSSCSRTQNSVEAAVAVRADDDHARWAFIW